MSDRRNTPVQSSGGTSQNNTIQYQTFPSSCYNFCCAGTLSLSSVNPPSLQGNALLFVKFWVLGATPAQSLRVSITVTRIIFLFWVILCPNENTRNTFANASWDDEKWSRSWKWLPLWPRIPIKDHAKWTPWQWRESIGSWPWSLKPRWNPLSRCFGKKPIIRYSCSN